MDIPSLSPIGERLISVFDQKPKSSQTGRTIQVNAVVSRVASWYEKLRNTMEYREDEVILRGAIERIVKRKLLFSNPKKIAEPLLRELMWARYIPNGSATEQTIESVQQSIDAHLELRRHLSAAKKISHQIIDQWFYQLISSDISYIVNPGKEKDAIAKSMFDILKNQVTITDDNPEVTTLQVFIAVRRAYSRDDIAFLRYHLFRYFCGGVKKETAGETAEKFIQHYKKIGYQLRYPLQDKIYGYCRRRVAAFFILEDILRAQKGKVQELVVDPEKFKQFVFEICDKRYSSITSKVHRAVVRSVIFIFMTKVIFAFLIEGTYERIVYGKILWGSIAINTIMPPVVMLVVGGMMRAPDKSNSQRIYNYIHTIMLDETPQLGNPLLTRKKAETSPIDTLFTVLWLFAFIISFGLIVYVLRRIDMNYVSISVFLFFLAIVSFLAYRIRVLANLFVVGDNQGFLTPFIDFLFLPFVWVGRKLTEGVSRINIILFLFDFVIEAPFKVIVGFFEQWFYYLHTKREDLD